jgi:hypothetical protein
MIRQPAVTFLLVITLDALRGIICSPYPFDGQVEHLGQERKNAICLIGAVLHGDLNSLYVATTARFYFLRSKLRQDNVVEHCAIVANALGPFLWNRMSFEIIRRKICDPIRCCGIILISAM